MKIIVTSDWHADAKTLGVRRYEEVRYSALTVVDAAIEEGADAFLFLGDLADPEPGAFWAIEVATACAARLSSAGIHSYWLTGNHDVVEDSIGTHTLLPLLGVDERVRVVSEPTWWNLLGENVGVVICALPYVSTARAYSPEETLRAMRAGITAGTRVVIASHLMLEGITPGSETEDMRRGRDVFLPLDLIDELFPEAVVTNGHYHRAQTYRLAGKPRRGVHIPGSIARLNKAESEHNPGLMALEV